jgi:hypothetical protein
MTGLGVLVVLNSRQPALLSKLYLTVGEAAKAAALLAVCRFQLAAASL